MVGRQQMGSSLGQLPKGPVKLSWWQRLKIRSMVGAPWQVHVGPFVLGVASLAFSLYSANAIRWVFSGLGATDRLESIMVWVIAGAFGVTGYFITRGLAFRMMNKDRIRGYVFICMLVEVIEISCNLLEALVAMQHSAQFQGFSPAVHTVLTVLVCVMWSSVPLVSIGLAVLDMDLEREKRGMVARAGQPQNMSYAGGYGGTAGAGSVLGSMPAPSYGSIPAYPQGGNGAVPLGRVYP